MGGGGMMKRQLPVKVVIINTQYVETDAISFKSVVQSLTGKDSTVAAAGAAATVAAKLKSRSSGASAFNYNNSNSNSNSNSDSNAIERVLERGVSFKDFDRMLKELPSLDELYTLYAE
ncbi:hypothetical protein ABFS83_13G059400 [Erythranthe nasuta]